MQIVWDEPKRQANLAKHGMDFADLDLDFFVSALVVPAKHDRLIAIGELDGATTVVFVRLGGEALLVISMRPDPKRKGSFDDEGIRPRPCCEAWLHPAGLGRGGQP